MANNSCNLFSYLRVAAGLSLTIAFLLATGAFGAPPRHECSVIPIPLHDAVWLFDAEGLGRDQPHRAQKGEETNAGASGPALQPIPLEKRSVLADFRDEPEFADGLVVFKNEEQGALRDNDFFMDHNAVLPLAVLADLVREEYGGQFVVRVTDAYDTGEDAHRGPLHREGRALDLTLTDLPSDPLQVSQAGQRELGCLAALAHLTGFDWVFHENTKHVHVSVRSSFLRRLTSDVRAQSPTVSPDGGTVVFERLSPTLDSSLWRIGADGSGLTQITDPPALTSHSNPSFGPSGLLAFCRVVRSDGGIIVILDTDVFAINSDGSGETLVADATIPVAYEEADGTPADGEVLLNRRSGNISIGLVVLDPSGGERVIATNANLFAHPRWNGDKSMVTYRGQPGGIFVVNAAGGGQIQVADQGFVPTWTHDGRVAFVHNFDVWTVNADGSALTQLTHLGDVSELDWSPDGTKAVLQRGLDLWILDLF